ncbi:SDR family oxidoreductase [Companilactobacillus farciminis]|uniref:SDR family oxidoreductase n=1 Tax=Companilactobacillus farciminis TaxID=1612 RepID=UPI00232B52AF|nr:SDR family oxidoreductase [Companilactobacillus farciminis]WCG35766.1 SDR family oxidoreductase [Companilactobacillus farciminis]
MSLKEKVIVITGASSGIGEATAKLLLKKGANVVIGARRKERLRQIADLSKDHVAYQVTDVTNLNSVNSLVKMAVDRFGKVDAIYNNAGIMPLSLLSENHHEEWQEMLNVNIMGVLNGISAVLPIMHKQGFGHILATDSVAGHQTISTAAVYSGTKYAVRAIMNGLRIEENKNCIKTSIISPGAVLTELYRSQSDEVSARRLQNMWKGENKTLSADDVAQAVIYALDAPERVNINEIVVRPLAES